MDPLGHPLSPNLIGSLQLFTQPFIISRGVGEPAQSMMFYSMQLYRQAFVYFNMGRAWLSLGLYSNLNDVTKPQPGETYGPSLR